jgi:hypothetical protein
LLGCNIAVDDVVQVVFGRVVGGNVRGMEGHCENHEREKKVRKTH